MSLHVHVHECIVQVDFEFEYNCDVMKRERQSNCSTLQTHEWKMVLLVCTCMPFTPHRCSACDDYEESAIKREHTFHGHVLTIWS